MNGGNSQGLGVPAYTLKFVISILTIVWTLCYLFHFNDGDDVFYSLIFSTADGIGQGSTCQVWEWPGFAAKHWVLNNGRSPNYLWSVGILGLLPHVVAKMICGAFWGLLLVMLLKTMGLIKCVSLLKPVIVITMYCLLMPWYCEGFQVAVWASYVLNSFIVICCIWILNHQHKTNITSFWPLLLGLLAGSGHEAASVPLLISYLALKLVGKTSYPGSTLVNNRIVSKLKLGFVIGTVLVTFSPGILRRFLTVNSQNSTIQNPEFWDILFTTLPIFAILILVISIMFLSVNGRLFLQRLRQTDFYFWALAAVLSSAFTWVSHLLGNSGWYSQLFSLIAIGIMLDLSKWRLPKFVDLVLALTVSVMLIAHSAFVASAQWRAYLTNRTIAGEYMKNGDELVFVDYPKLDLSNPLLLGRIHLPVNTYIYNSTGFAHYFGCRDGKEYFAVLPTQYRELVNDLTPEMSCEHGGLGVGLPGGPYVSLERPDDAEEKVMWPKHVYWETERREGSYSSIPVKYDNQTIWVNQIIKD